MPVALNDVFRFTMIGQWNLQRIVNIFWRKAIVVNGTNPDAEACEFLNNRMQFLYAQELLPRISTGMQVETYESRILNQSVISGPLQFRAAYQSPGVVGLDTSSGGLPSLPSFCSVNAWLRTNFPGRRDRGRKSYGPVPEADTTGTLEGGNELVPASGILWSVANTNMHQQEVITTTGGDFTTVPVVFSLANFRLGVPATQFAHTITQSSVRAVLGSQLHRKRKASGV